MTSNAKQVNFRLPEDAKQFIVEQAAKYGSSQTSEIIRSIRERMDRVAAATGAVLPTDPAAASDNAALPGGIITTNG